MLCDTFPVGPGACNCVILADLERREALVVDPGGDAERILAVIAHHDLRVRWLVHTHAHVDHFCATRSVRDAVGGEVCLHPADRPLWAGWAEQATRRGLNLRLVPPVTRDLAAGEVLRFGDLDALVLHTPGHSPGSICLETTAGPAPLLLTGDTLLRHGTGGSGHWGGDPAALERSIRQLCGRDPRTRVIPGHGPETTTGEEARANPAVRPPLRP